MHSPSSSLRTVQRLYKLNRHLSLPNSLKSFQTMSRPNLTVYTFGTPNGHKATVTLEELNLDYKVETINISQNTQKEPWFLEIK